LSEAQREAKQGVDQNVANNATKYAISLFKTRHCVH
jgi:hypothetical protein